MTAIGSLTTASSARTTSFSADVAATQDHNDTGQKKTVAATTATSSGTTEPTTYGTLASSNGSTVPARGSIVNISA